MVSPVAFVIMGMHGIPWELTGDQEPTQTAGVTGSFWKESIPKLNLEG